MIRNKICILILLFLSLTYFSFSEIIISGSGAFNGHGVFQLDSSEDNPYEFPASFLVTENISSYSDFAEMSITGHIESNVTSLEDIDMSLDEFSIKIYPLSFLTLKFGRYIHTPSFATTLPTVDFFSRNDYECVFSGDTDSMTQPTHLIQVEAYFQQFYLRGIVEPYPTDIPFFSTDSLWFPNFGIPEEISFTSPISNTIYLGELSIQSPESSLSFAERIGYSLELGGSISFIDFLLLYYHGLDTTPLFTASLHLNGLYEDYEAYLIPQETIIDSLGSSILAILGNFKLLFEQAYVFQKTYLSEAFTYSDASFETLTFESPSYILTGGLMYENWDLQLFACLEYRKVFVLEPDSDMVDPMFQNLITSTLSWTFAGDRITLLDTVIMSLADYSLTNALRFTYTSLDQVIEAGFTLPLFFGGEETDFGQYSNIIYPTIFVTIHF